MSEKAGELKKLEVLNKSLVKAQKNLVEKSRQLSQKERKLTQKETESRSGTKKIAELTEEFKLARKHLIDESDIKKELMKSFLERWETGFHQLQFVKQEIQNLIHATQDLIHSDLQELYHKEAELQKKETPIIKEHPHKSGKEYKKHVKKIKNLLEKQVEKNKKQNKEVKKDIPVKDLIKQLEILIHSGKLEEAKKQLKNAEQIINKIKDETQKKVLSYELQDLKTSIKLAELT